MLEEEGSAGSGAAVTRALGDVSGLQTCTPLTKELKVSGESN